MATRRAMPKQLRTDGVYFSIGDSRPSSCQRPANRVGRFIAAAIQRSLAGERIAQIEARVIDHSKGVDNVSQIRATSLLRILHYKTMLYAFPSSQWIKKCLVG